jgi:hypothetical protein
MLQMLFCDYFLSFLTVFVCGQKYKIFFSAFVLGCAIFTSRLALLYYCIPMLFINIINIITLIHRIIDAQQTRDSLTKAMKD